ncbi:MAG: ATP-dependent helicase [Bacteroidetes bacterium]|nr:MAG: ATP-dependent helicase [Bacteroidota bacterium]
MGVVIEHIQNEYKISFPYKPYLVELIKKLPGRKFNHFDKSWSVPATSLDELKNFASRTGAVWGKIAEDLPGVAIPQEETELPDLQVDIPLRRELFPYQRSGVAYALQKKRLIIGDQPGLGKTAQAIATIEGAQAFPCLIICPSSLKINWKREIEQWTGKEAMILDDRTRLNFHFYYQAGLNQYFIVNYESLKKYFVEKIDKPKNAKLRLNHIHFKKVATGMFNSVVIDESHRVKSVSTQQTKFTKGICNGKDWILALTGTPVINKPKDLISQLGIIGRIPELFSYSQFVNRYCSGPREASNLKELNQVLNSHCFYRRDKSKVLKDLPAKVRQVIVCDIDTRKEYHDAMRDLEKYLQEYRGATDAQIIKAMRGKIMVEIGILKNISARGKIEAVREFIDDTTSSGEKLVVFAHLKEIIGKLKEAYPKAVTITGEDSTYQRQDAVDQFQNDPSCKLIICSTKAAGVGLTLTASSRVCFIELPWTYADCEQAEDRCHRIGQVDSVMCTYFLGDQTIDQKIYKLILEKKDIARQVTGSQEEIEENVVSQLIDLFNQGHEASKESKVFEVNNF